MTLEERRSVCRLKQSAAAHSADAVNDALNDQRCRDLGSVPLLVDRGRPTLAISWTRNPSSQLRWRNSVRSRVKSPCAAESLQTQGKFRGWVFGTIFELGSFRTLLEVSRLGTLAGCHLPAGTPQPGAQRLTLGLFKFSPPRSPDQGEESISDLSQVLSVTLQVPAQHFLFVPGSHHQNGN